MPQFTKNQTIIVPEEKTTGRIVTIDVTDDDRVLYFVMTEDGSVKWRDAKDLEAIPDPNAPAETETKKSRATTTKTRSRRR